jgi:hypothetical protein
MSPQVCCGEFVMVVSNEASRKEGSVVWGGPRLGRDSIQSPPAATSLERADEVNLGSLRQRRNPLASNSPIMSRWAAAV